MAQKRFHSAVEKLMNAFIMGKIKHGSCCNCAVGNLCDNDNGWIGTITSNSSFGGSGVLTINRTGYSIREIAFIEMNFEGRPGTMDAFPLDRDNKLDAINDPDGFKGLCAVFDYLVSIEDFQEEEKGTDIFELLEAINN